LDELALLAEALAAGEDVPIEPEPDDELPTPTDLWMREVRLRRLLGIEKELQAIRRVAQWMRDRASTQQLQLLAARLREIQQDVDPNPSTDEALLLKLAEIYAILGEVSDATNIYRSLADQALAEGDEAALQNRLETLAGLQSAWFYFDDAAATYGELLQLTQLEPNREIEYLKARSHNLEQAEDFSAAVVSQQRLLEIYNQNEPLWTLVPALQHNLGKNYLALGDQTEASRYFRSAYTNALDQSQLSLAAASIRSLANIYTTAERWDDVRYLYEQLILVEQRANNAFGLMETFDSLGQLYEQLEQPGEALTAYREGLIMARSLNHREDYFEAQIARLMGEGDDSVGG
jgi:hypothetical protein